jgi:hypothetical protein
MRTFPHALLLKFEQRVIEVKSNNTVSQKNIMQNKFPERSVVYAIAKPDVKLIVKRYMDRVYYCRALLDPAQKELTFFERELTAEPPVTQG